MVIEMAETKLKSHGASESEEYATATVTVAVRKFLRRRAVKVALTCSYAVGVYLLSFAVLDSRAMALFITTLCVGMAISSFTHINDLRQYELNMEKKVKVLNRRFGLVSAAIVFLLIAYAIALSESRARGVEFHELMIDTLTPVVSSLKGYIPRAGNLAYDLAGGESQHFAVHATVVNHIAVAVIMLITLVRVIWQIKVSSFKEYVASSEAFNRVTMPYCDFSAYPKINFLFYLLITSGGCFMLYSYEFYLGEIEPFYSRGYFFMLFDFCTLVMFLMAGFSFIPSMISVAIKIITESDTKTDVLD